jgi:hypothetical protein
MWRLMQEEVIKREEVGDDLVEPLTVLGHVWDGLESMV